MIKLNIYKAHSNEIEKTYETEEAHVMYGTLEDLAEIVHDTPDTGSKNTIAAIGKAVTKSIPVINALLPDIFPGLTKEELRRTRTDELISMVIEIALYTAGEIMAIGGDSSGN